MNSVRIYIKAKKFGLFPKTHQSIYAFKKVLWNLPAFLSSRKPNKANISGSEKGFFSNIIFIFDNLLLYIIYRALHLKESIDRSLKINMISNTLATIYKKRSYIRRMVFSFYVNRLTSFQFFKIFLSELFYNLIF